MDDRAFVRDVASRLQCDDRRAEEVIHAVFGELHDRLTPGEAEDVAAQLPSGLQRLWRAEDRPGRRVERTHAIEFVARVRYWAALRDDDEANRAVRAVFRELQKLLGSSTGQEGEAGDVLAQLPKDLKKLWLAAARET